MRKVLTVLGIVVLLAIAASILPAAAQTPPPPTATPVPASAPPAWLGLEAADVNARLAKESGINLGVLVLKVVEGGPAAAGRIQPKDIILTVNGKGVNSVADLGAFIKTSKVGDALDIAGRRGGDALIWKVTLAARPEPEPKSLFPNVPELAGVTRDKLFSHVLSGQVNMLDKDGKPLKIAWVAGVVTAVTGDSVTVKPNDGSAEVIYNLTGVKVMGKLEKGAQVAVVSVNDQLRTVVRTGALAHLGAKRPAPPVQAKPTLRVLTGEVRSVAETSLVLVIGGDEVKVVLAKDVKVAPSKEALKVGAKVAVSGKKQDDGSLVVSHVQVLPANATAKGLERGLHNVKERLQKTRPLAPKPMPVQPKPLALPAN